MEVKIVRKQKSSSPQSNTKKASCYARFTKKEKEVLYALFREHEEIIDIKHRKNSSAKMNTMSIRECWQHILTMYNCHQNISTQRNIKQIQKFWLNSRLRKQFPPRKSEIFSIKSEPGISIPAESIEKIEHVFEDNLYQTTTSNEEIDNVQNDVQELPSCIEQISTEKLSLNDLLHFKGTTTKPNAISTAENENVLQMQVQMPASFVETVSENKEQTSQTATIQDHPVTTTTIDCSQMHQPDGICIQRNDVIGSSLEEKLNYFKLKEAELKYEEEQIRLERLKIDLEKSKEELKHVQEMHKLQTEEMRTKLRILFHEENKLNKIS